MHILDILILFLLIGFGIGGIRRGFLFELMITIGLAASLILTLIFREELQELAGRFAEPGWELRWASGAGVPVVLPAHLFGVRLFRSSPAHLD